MKSILVTLAAAGLLMASPANAAFIFDAENDSHVISMNGLVDREVVDGLRSTLTLTLYQVSGNDAYFRYLLENTSGDEITASEVGAFGFNSLPDFIGGQLLGGYFNNTGHGNVPGGLPDVALCLTAGPNCRGAASRGIELGDSGSGEFRLTYGSAFTQVTLTDLFVRYQGIVGPGLRGESGVGIPDGGGLGTAVPEPSTWAFMILGFGGAGAMLRHRRQHLALEKMAT